MSVVGVGGWVSGWMWVGVRYRSSKMVANVLDGSLMFHAQRQ